MGGAGLGWGSFSGWGLKGMLPYTCIREKLKLKTCHVTRILECS